MNHSKRRTNSRRHRHQVRGAVILLQNDVIIVVMSQTDSVVCNSVASTQSLGQKIGQVLRGGEVIVLTSDLGGGKTAFTKGIGKGMGVTGVIQSPTFTISYIHQADRNLELQHFDFYRLQDPGIMRAELAEALEQDNAVVVIEWADVVKSVLPGERLEVKLQVKSEEVREIAFSGPESYQYIFSAIKEYKDDINN